MATWEDVRRIVRALPETAEDVTREGGPAWSVRGRPLAWDRPLRTGDLAALGDAAPAGPILCVRTPDVGAKEALVADEPSIYFTTPHFNGYPAVLVRLKRIPAKELRELIVEAWLSRVPRRLAREYLESRRWCG